MKQSTQLQMTFLCSNNGLPGLIFWLSQAALRSAIRPPASANKRQILQQCFTGSSKVYQQCAYRSSKSHGCVICPRVESEEVFGCHILVPQYRMHTWKEAANITQVQYCQYVISLQLTFTNACLSFGFLNSAFKSILPGRMTAGSWASTADPCLLQLTCSEIRTNLSGWLVVIKITTSSGAPNPSKQFRNPLKDLDAFNCVKTLSSRVNWKVWRNDFQANNMFLQVLWFYFCIPMCVCVKMCIKIMIWVIFPFVEAQGGIVLVCFPMVREKCIDIFKNDHGQCWKLGHGISSVSRWVSHYPRPSKSHFKCFKMFQKGISGKIKAFVQDSEGVISHVFVHLDEAKISLDMTSNWIHEGGLASSRLSMQQVTAVVRDSMLGIKCSCLIFQEPFEVIQQRSLHTSAHPRKIVEHHPEKQFVSLVRSKNIRHSTRQVKLLRIGDRIKWYAVRKPWGYVRLMTWVFLH